MVIKKIGQKQHGDTRELYESVFAEDTAEFVDYYYEWKTNDNVIFTVEEDDRICSMIHLNPYILNITGKKVHSHYIVAVATHPDYRKRGYMGEVLKAAMKDMYNSGEPFTFLMPAAEKIYTPYDFRYIYDQMNLTCGVEELLAYAGGNIEKYGKRLECRVLDEAEMGELCSFSNRVLQDRYQISANRDEKYYVSLQNELKSEGGDILVFWDSEAVAGYLYYAIGERIEIREPVYELVYENEYWNLVCDIFAVMKKEKNTKKEMQINSVMQIEKRVDIEEIEIQKDMRMNYSIQTERDFHIAGLSALLPGVNIEEKPMIMARILKLERFGELLTSEGEPVDFELCIQDEILKENNGCFRWRIDAGGGTVEKVRACTNRDRCMPVADLCSWLFGYRPLDKLELIDENSPLKNEDLKKKMKRVKVLDKIFLNEVV